jgi:hypothetical protein
MQIDDEGWMSEAEMYELLARHAEDRCALCGVQLRAHLGSNHYFVGELVDLGERKQ